jgi:hypothetical protein
MAETIADIINKYPEVKKLVVVDYDDGEAFGLSADGVTLRLYQDDSLAHKLFLLPGADGTEGHFIEGSAFRVYGTYVVGHDS